MKHADVSEGLDGYVDRPPNCINSSIPNADGFGLWSDAPKAEEMQRKFSWGA